MYITLVRCNSFHSTGYSETKIFIYIKKKPHRLTPNTGPQPFSQIILAPSPVFPVNLFRVLKAESTKLSIPKAICDPSDPLDSRHGNALAL